MKKRGAVKATQKGKARCQAGTKDGRACRAPAMAGGLCYFHANPNKASELGRIGGRKNRRMTEDSAAALLCLETATELRETVGRLIADTLSGKCNPRFASGPSTAAEFTAKSY